MSRSAILRQAPSGIFYSVPSNDYEINEVYILLEDKWLAWPGGQATTDLNPQELFTSEEMGLGDVAVDWNVGNGGTSAKIVWADGSAFGPATSATGKKQIKVRYDTKSDDNTKAKAVKIEATKGEGDSAVTEQEYRTVFKITWSESSPNTNADLDQDNKREFGDDTGQDTRKCEFNWDGDNQASRIAAKIECRATFQPSGVDYPGKGVAFPYYALRANRERELMAMRDIRGAEGLQTLTAQVRSTTYLQWQEDLGTDSSGSDSDDTQFPSKFAAAGHPDKFFRIDSPGRDTDDLNQIFFRYDFREYLKWHDGTSWVRCTEYHQWYANATGVLPTCDEGSPCNHGSGENTEDAPNDQPVANAGNDANVPKNTNYTLSGSGDDDDCDSLTYKWTQTQGPTVTLSDATAPNPSFTTPGDPTTLKFKLEVEDGTQNLGEYAPDNSKSAPDEVEITVTN